MAGTLALFIHGCGLNIGLILPIIGRMKGNSAQRGVAGGSAPTMRLAAWGAGHQRSLCEMLDEAELFTGLGWDEINTLSQFVSAHEADAGHELFSEGSPGTSLYVLVQGCVETRKDDGSRHCAVIAVERRGRSIGEMALIDGEPRSATCVVTAPSLLLCMSREDFRRLGEQHPALALRLVLRIARQISRRLRATSGQLVEYLGGDAQ